jgi:plastocyanin/uncharacterized membrane protein
MFWLVHRGFVRQQLVIALLFLLCAITGSVAQQQGGTSASSPQVILKTLSFQPAELKVRPGETVEFKNHDIFAHTVTADDGSFDSGLIQPGGTWKLTVSKPETIAYHCTPHPNMKAKLVATSAESAPSNTNASATFPAFYPPSGPQELHPILVNFTAALLPLALLSDLLGRQLRRSSLHNAAAWMVLYAAIITPLTGLAGWWWKAKTGVALPPSLITLHQWLGTSLAVAFILIAVWRWRIYRRDAVPGFGYLAIATVVVLALIYQGSVGGAMVFGH